MQFNTLDDIKKEEYVGFLRVGDILDNRKLLKQIPHKTEHKKPIRGLYLILRLNGKKPRFLVENPSGVKNIHNHSFSVAELESKWDKVKESVVVYLGQAGGVRGGKLSNSSLHRRLRQYMDAMKRTGKKQSSHNGGRAIWQFDDYDDLVVCWKPVAEGIDPKLKEQQLIREFREIYGDRPLANRTT